MSHVKFNPKDRIKSRILEDSRIQTTSRRSRYTRIPSWIAFTVCSATRPALSHHMSTFL